MIKHRKLLWQIFPANVLTILVAIVVVSWYGTTSFQEFYLTDTESDLQARANLIKSRVKDLIRQGMIDELRNYCIYAGRESGTRITVIVSNGKVIADSKENPEVMDNHSSRPEVKKALSGNPGSARRFSKTLKENFIYVAVPLYNVLSSDSKKTSDSVVDMVLRTSVSVASLDQTIANIKIKITFAATAVIMLAAAVTLLISRNISKPLEQMTKSAEQFSRGDFRKGMLPGISKAASLEVVTLGASMDRMAELLDEKIQEIVGHRNQLQTVFSSMAEAVIAIDHEERILSVNDAAALLLDVDKVQAKGMIVQQIVRNVKLQQQVSSVLTTGEPIEDEIVLRDGQGDRFLRTNVVTMHSGTGKSLGALVVMNDMTKLRRLEGIRRDFVANVSHELRTPITSIQGYVETLLDGALDVRADAQRFLAIVLHQSKRLTTIIDDLLTLSRIEEEARTGDILLQRGQLGPVIDSVVQTCKFKADMSGVKVIVDCSEDLYVMMNPNLLEQAVLNLLVNAITYSQKGESVKIMVQIGDGDTDKKVRVVVRDSGCGIAKEHQGRIFERFYRCDQARSRAHGGTGLGLAIVKHIAQAHGGMVEVSSVEGDGTEFILTLNGAS